ncbi:MAG: hypothetical protein RMI34_05245 [Chloroherpetonaceae bacterium]|nr:hypothetical protein [Chloroherpetonaceae bacterium]MCS7211040.1 hypothetical protein [Chloroherpetonaceae bacterium]MDW8019464.1 hypothetical protein [Chloroherpetonaceae bacterium]
MLRLRNLLLILLLFASLSACRRDDNPVSESSAPPGNFFTVNGAGFNNRTFTIPETLPLPILPPKFALYDSTLRTTAVFQIAEFNFTDSSATAISFTFRGNRAGVYEGTSVGAQLQLGRRNFAAGDTAASGTVISNTSFRVNVTRYDDAQKRVQGRYNGTFREVGPSGATVTVTGEFDVPITSIFFPIGSGSATEHLHDLNKASIRLHTLFNQP